MTRPGLDPAPEPHPPLRLAGATEPAPITGEAGPAPLLWRDRDVIRALAIGARTLDKLLSSGRFPRPDVRIGRARRWRPSTVLAWIDEEARRQAIRGGRP